MAAYVFWAGYSTYSGFRPKAKGKKGSPATSGRTAATGPVTSKDGSSSAVDTDVNEPAASSSSLSSSRKSRRRRAPRVEVDAAFFERLGKILRIVLPGNRKKLLLHSFFLVFRTMLSLYVAALDGQIVSALVRGEGQLFIKRIATWMVVAVPVGAAARTHEPGAPRSLLIR